MIFGLEVTELLRAVAQEALPRDSSRPALLLSLCSPHKLLLQTGYCVSCDTTAVRTHMLTRGWRASKNLVQSYIHSFIWFGLLFLCLFLNKASSFGHILWCSITAPPRLTPRQVPKQFVCQKTSSPVPSLSNVSLQAVAIHVTGTSIQRAPHSPLVLPPGWIAGSNELLCLLTHFAGSSWNKKQKCWPLVREPVAMLFAASLGSGSAKIWERSLDLPGQFRVSRGPYSLDNLQSSVTIYGSLSKPNSDSNRSPIRNRNTSRNKVCCQARGTSYEVGPGSMEMGQAQLGVGFWWQGLGSKNGA